MNKNIISKKVGKIIVGLIIFICLIVFAIEKPNPTGIDVFGMLLTGITIIFINRNLFEE